MCNSPKLSVVTTAIFVETLVDAWIYSLDLRWKPTKRVLEDFPIESGDCWVVDITFLQFGGHPWGSSG